MTIIWCSVACGPYSGLLLPKHWRLNFSPSLGRSLLGKICTFGESERGKKQKTMKWSRNQRMRAQTQLTSLNLILFHLLPSSSCRCHCLTASQSDITTYTTTTLPAQEPKYHWMTAPTQQNPNGVALIVFILDDNWLFWWIVSEPLVCVPEDQG